VPRGTYDLVASAQAKRWNDPAVAYSPPADPFEGGGEPIKLRIGVATGGDNTGWRILLVVLALAWPGVILLWRRAKD